jgi:Leucine-rich repeat (LRR) protein
MWVNKKYHLSIYLVFLSFVCLSQTAIPDPNFEQALIDLGFDSAPINGFVPTANISSITTLNLEAKNISNLTGIQNFTALNSLNCNNNQLTSLNVSQNTTLSQLFCNNNALTLKM